MLDIENVAFGGDALKQFHAELFALNLGNDQLTTYHKKIVGSNNFNAINLQMELRLW